MGSTNRDPGFMTTASTSPATWFLDSDDDCLASASSGHHSLDDCSLCGRYLQKNRDLYMYKGDTAFCSEDCRDEKIRIDELQERANRRRRAKVAAASGSASVSAQVETPADVVAVEAL